MSNLRSWNQRNNFWDFMNSPDFPFNAAFGPEGRAAHPPPPPPAGGPPPPFSEAQQPPPAHGEEKYDDNDDDDPPMDTPPEDDGPHSRDPFDGHGPGFPGRHGHGHHRGGSRGGFGGCGPRGGHFGRHGRCSGRRGRGPWGFGAGGAPQFGHPGFWPHVLGDNAPRDFDMSKLGDMLNQFLGNFNPNNPNNNDNNNSTARGGDDSATGGRDFAPEIDIFDTDDSYVVYVSLSGARKEDVGVNWDADESVLNVSGVIHRPGDEEFLKKLALDERRVGVFERKVRLGTKEKPAQIEADEISAKMEDGILVVKVPKVEKEYVEVKKVDIQ